MFETEEFDRIKSDRIKSVRAIEQKYSLDFHSSEPSLKENRGFPADSKTLHIYLYFGLRMYLLSYQNFLNCKIQTGRVRCTNAICFKLKNLYRVCFFLFTHRSVSGHKTVILWFGENVFFQVKIHTVLF